MQGLQQLLSSLDTTMLELKESVDGMRPAYSQALQMLSAANYNQTAQKNNLVCYCYDKNKAITFRRQK